MQPNQHGQLRYPLGLRPGSVADGSIAQGQHALEETPFGVAVTPEFVDHPANPEAYDPNRSYRGAEANTAPTSETAQLFQDGVDLLRDNSRNIFRRVVGGTALLGAGVVSLVNNDPLVVRHMANEIRRDRTIGWTRRHAAWLGVRALSSYAGAADSPMERRFSQNISNTVTRAARAVANPTRRPRIIS